jgi:hypothetical protein
VKHVIVSLMLALTLGVTGASASHKQPGVSVLHQGQEVFFQPAMEHPLDYTRYSITITYADGHTEQLTGNFWNADPRYRTQQIDVSVTDLNPPTN